MEGGRRQPLPNARRLAHSARLSSLQSATRHALHKPK